MQKNENASFERRHQTKRRAKGQFDEYSKCKNGQL